MRKNNDVEELVLCGKEAVVGQSHAPQHQSVNNVVVAFDGLHDHMCGLCHGFDVMHLHPPSHLLWP